MKTLYVTLFLLFTFSFNTQAQSLLEAAGGIKTDFAFTTKDADMGVESQILIRRSVVGVNNGIDAASAYGTESFFLELISSKRIGTQKQKGKKRKYFMLKFYDANDQVIAEYERSEDLVKVRSNEQEEEAKYYITTINLRNIPLVFLEKTQRIELIRYWEGNFNVVWN